MKSAQCLCVQSILLIHLTGCGLSVWDQNSRLEDRTRPRSGKTEKMEPVALPPSQSGPSSTVLRPSETPVAFAVPSPEVVTGTGRNFYVSPQGTLSGDGSLGKPWDMRTAVNIGSKLQPGDTLLFLAGGHGNPGELIEVRGFSGTATKPITFRSAPGERAILRAGIMLFTPYTHIRDLEFTSSRKNICLDLHQGEGMKAINNIIHDCAYNGIGAWSGAPGAELYGNIIFHNGTVIPGTTRGHGHGIYTQNDDLARPKLIQQNIVFNSMGFGFHAYTEKGFVRGFRVLENVGFNSGRLYSDSVSDNFAVLGADSMAGIVLENNVSYFSQGLLSGYNRLGWATERASQDIAVRNNYFIRGLFATQLFGWSMIEFSNNMMYSDVSQLFLSRPLSKTDYNGYRFASNAYYGPGRIRVDSSYYDLSSFQKLTGLDQNSQASPFAPAGLRVIKHLNRYNSKRMDVVVMNFDRTPIVKLDLSEILKPGDQFVLRDVQNLWDPALKVRVYSEGGVSVSLSNLMLHQAVDGPRSLPHTTEEFNVFVVEKQ